MRLETPGWWHGTSRADQLKARLLAPAGFLYGVASNARFAMAKPYRSKLPVICVGNFTVGGAGKTPLALAVARLLRDAGHDPAFLTRGYGGSLAGPHVADPDGDSAAEVGDEALLLARLAPTVLARDRKAGAAAIEKLGAGVIVMDDGFQNPHLAKDLALIAVDAAAGFGNNRVFPAGPLRAPLSAQRRRAHAAVLIGDGATSLHADLAGLPVLKGQLKPSGETGWLRDAPVLAFSGIGRPRKFFTTLEALGARLAASEAFPDHHPYSEADALQLIGEAGRMDAQLVTTEKDWVRLAAPAGPLAELKAKARALPVQLVLDSESAKALHALLDAAVNR